MNKKDLKMYVAPTMDVVELETSVALLAGSGGTGGADNTQIGDDTSIEED